MISLDISTILFVYLFFSVMALLVSWFFLDFGTRMKMFFSEERYIWHCSICSNNYIDSRSEDISKCPRCGSYNQRDFMGSESDGGNLVIQKEG